MFSTFQKLWKRRQPSRFYGQFNPPQDQILYETYFLKRRKGVFLECGAFDGILESSCLFFEESLDWKGHNIEACPIIFEKLIANRPRSKNYCVALGDRDGEAVFSLAVHPKLGQIWGNGSLQHAPAHKRQLDDEGCTIEEYHVKLVTYRTFLELSGVTSLDLFVLDVEGTEEAVIAGMRGAPVLPKVLCVEHGWCNAGRLDLSLQALGFRQDRVVHNNLVYLHHSY